MKNKKSIPQKLQIYKVLCVFYVSLLLPVCKTISHSVLGILSKSPTCLKH